MNNEEKITRYLGKIAANTERIAKALEERNNPNQRRNVKDTPKREPKNLDEQLDELQEALDVAKAISGGATVHYAVGGRPYAITKEEDE